MVDPVNEVLENRQLVGEAKLKVLIYSTLYDVRSSLTLCTCGGAIGGQLVAIPVCACATLQFEDKSSCTLQFELRKN